jgi:hypothetical protein
MKELRVSLFRGGVVSCRGALAFKEAARVVGCKVAFFFAKRGGYGMLRRWDFLFFFWLCCSECRRKQLGEVYLWRDERERGELGEERRRKDPRKVNHPQPSHYITWPSFARYRRARRNPLLYLPVLWLGPPIKAHGKGLRNFQ